MSMTEIMAWHRDIAWNHQTGESVCGDCDKVLGPMDADMSEQDGWLRAHVADELTEAGYGNLQDAKSEALDAAVALLRDRGKWTRSDHGPYVIKTGYDDDGRGNEAADIDEWYADWLEQFPYREQEQA